MNPKKDGPRLLAQEIYQAYERPRPHLGQLRQDLAAQGVEVSGALLRKWRERGHLGPSYPDDRDGKALTITSLVNDKLAKVKREATATTGKLTLAHLESTVLKAHGAVHGLLDLITDSIRPLVIGEDVVPAIKLADADDLASAARAVGIIAKAMDDVLVHNKLLEEARATDANRPDEPSPLPSPKALLRLVRQEQEAHETRKAHG